jgi:dsDNA-specific endonuclease/ATPase MutS2
MKVLSGEGKAQRVLELHQVRHPLVELQESVSYIANDVAFAPSTSTLHLITGPNMGGKSTYIRSVGVAVLMAQMGSFIPADAGSKMSVVGKLYYLPELPSLSVSKALFFLVLLSRIRINPSSVSES